MTLRDSVLELLSHLDIEQCGYCEGTGRERRTREDACHECGGIGEIVVGRVLPHEVRDMQRAIHEGNRR